MCETLTTRISDTCLFSTYHRVDIPQQESCVIMREHAMLQVL